MNRVALLTLCLAISPALAAAQVPPPPPPVPMPAPLPAPAFEAAVPLPPLPPVAPLAPLAPMPPMPPVPAFAWADMDIDFPIDLDMHIDLGDMHEFTSAFALAQSDVRDAQRQQAEIARQAADLARTQVRIGGDAYNSGLNALQQQQYERALEAFDRVIANNNARVDAALYWKAFAEFRLARVDASLQSIAQLQKAHAQSRYLSDARVLETEVRKQSGQKLDPAQLDDDEIKLLAIQGLERTEQVVPLLEGVLNAPNSLNVKKRALYVLALRSDPRAREVLLRYAKGGGNPDLQIEGVRLLVSRRDAQTTDAVLRELYESSSDPSVKRVIIDAYRSRLRSNARPGGATATATTATSGAVAQELTALYQRETDADLRRHIASVLVSIGSADQVATVIKGERDVNARQRAIGVLAVRDNPQATRALTDLYSTFSDIETRESIISALAGQQNAEALIALARTETNVRLKTRIVRHLSEMAPRSKAAADYLMDVIK